MAESETGQEKTEEPTPKRLDKAREEGEVARSRELNTTFVLVGGVAALIAFGGNIGKGMLELMRFNFAFDRADAFDTYALTEHLAHTLQMAVLSLLPLFGVLLVAALAGPVSLGGWLISGKALAPKFSRLNPLKGLQRMFSANAMVEFLKAIAKFVLVAGVAIALLATLQSDLLQLGNEALKPAIQHALTVTGWTLLGVSSALILIAVVDVPWQIYQHQKKLRMTKQEVKDEMKDTEGKPEVKGRIRQLQRQLAQRRMMEKVPEADVVITNPDHFSVALKYDSAGSGAPVVVAKGVDLIALKIREIAKAHEVTLLQAPPLARAIYFTTELDEEIPASLYLAVAQVLAYVYQLDRFRNGRAERPRKPQDIPVPPDMQYDSRGRVQ